MSSHSNWLIRPSCHTVVICSHAGQKGAVVQPESRLVLQQCLAPVFAQHRRLGDVTSLIPEDSMHRTNSSTGGGGGVEQGGGGLHLKRRKLEFYSETAITKHTLHAFERLSFESLFNRLEVKAR